MNFLLFLSTVIWSTVYVEAPAVGQAWVNPLPVLYYPLQQRYTLSSVDIVDKMLSVSNINKPEFSLILLFCPSTYLLLYYKTLSSAYETISERKLCEDKFSLNIFHHPDHYDYGIGYKFSNAISRRLTYYELPEFSSKYQDHGYELLVIWYDRDRSKGNTFSTFHHFYTYHPSLLPSQTCEDYHASFHNSEDFHEFDVEPYYEMKNQNELFEHFQGLPTPSEDLSKNPLKEYLVNHRMVPTDDFVEESRRMATCTNLITAPIWKSISEGPIKKVEQFVQRVAQHVYQGSLFVKTKHSNPLTFMSRSRKKEENLYLDFDKKRIPVNAYYVKIIGYRVPFPIKSEEEINNKHSEIPMFYMIILVNNQLSDNGLRLCNQERAPICRMYGWDIELNDDERKLVYCCSMQDVQAKEIIVPWPHPDPHKTFDLYHVVTHQKEDGMDLFHMDITPMLTGQKRMDVSESESQLESGISEI